MSDDEKGPFDGMRVGDIIDATDMPEYLVTSSGPMLTGTTGPRRLRITSVSKNSIGVEEVKE